MFNFKLFQENPRKFFYKMPPKTIKFLILMFVLAEIVFNVDAMFKGKSSKNSGKEDAQASSKPKTKPKKDLRATRSNLETSTHQSSPRKGKKVERSHSEHIQPVEYQHTYQSLPPQEDFPLLGRSPSRYDNEATYAACNCLQQFGQLCARCFGNHGNYQTEEEIDEALKHIRLSNEDYERSKGNVGGGGSRIEQGVRGEEDNVGGEGGDYHYGQKNVEGEGEDYHYGQQHVGGEGGDYHYGQQHVGGEGGDYYYGQQNVGGGGGDYYGHQGEDYEEESD